MQTAEQRRLIATLLQKAQDFRHAGDAASEEKALRLVLRACQKHPIAQFELGRLLVQQGRFAEGTSELELLVANHPELTEARFLLANSLTALGRYSESISHYQFVVRKESNRAPIWNNLGVALHRAGRLPEAADALRRGVSLSPDANGWFNLGNLLKEQDETHEAELAFRQALTVEPNHHGSLVNLGAVRYECAAFAEAEALFQKAAVNRPDIADLHLNLGNALREQGKSKEAVASYRKALILEPNNGPAHRLVGAELYALGEIAHSIQHSGKAIRIDESDVAAHCNLAMAHLIGGNHADGWRENEWRLQNPKHPIPELPEPRWNLEDGRDKTLLIVGEQGAGDTIQFARYIALIYAKFHRVTLACQSGLGALMLENRIADRVLEVAPEADLYTEEFHFSAPLMSLPFLLGLTGPEASPAYLKANAKKTEKWRTRFAKSAGLKVGVVWAGNPEHYNDHNRSIPLPLFEGLRSVSGISLFSLQTGESGQTPESAAFALPLWDRLDDYSDTAAAIEELDLVITVDTSVAHLAGAMGKPVWTLLPALSDWRWGRTSETTNWYPSMRLFRQPKAGDWASVMENVCSELFTMTLARAA